MAKAKAKTKQPSKAKYIKLYFKQAPPGTGYHAGHTHEVPEKMAKEYCKKGYAKEAK